MDDVSKRSTELLEGKTVLKVLERRNGKEIYIEFTDGTRLFIDHQPEELEISITGGIDRSQIEEQKHQ